MRAIGSVAGGARPVAARGGRPNGFAVGVAAGPLVSAPDRATGVAAVGMGLLGIQESRDAAARDAAAARRADSLLAELQGLQADLLGAGADPARLARLAALGEGEDGADPGLRDAVQAIGLRARIELARRGWPAEGGRAVSSA